MVKKEGDWTYSGIGPETLDAVANALREAEGEKTFAEVLFAAQLKQYELVQIATTLQFAQMLGVINFQGNLMDVSARGVLDFWASFYGYCHHGIMPD